MEEGGLVFLSSLATELCSGGLALIAGQVQREGGFQGTMSRWKKLLCSLPCLCTVVQPRRGAVQQRRAA